MGFLKWLYRLPGRINRSFATTALATDVEGPGAGVPQMNVAAMKVVVSEIETANSGESDDKDAHPGK